MEPEYCGAYTYDLKSGLLCTVERRLLDRFLVEHHNPCFAKEYAIGFGPGPGAEDMPWLMKLNCGAKSDM